MSRPLTVGCLMATKDRPHLVDIALSSFANQTPSRDFSAQLVVVEDGSHDVRPQLERAHIWHKCLYHRHEGRQVDKIAHAIRATRCDVYALWDDDDWHHPDYLQTMVAEIAHGAESVGLSRVRFYDMFTESWWLHVHPECIDATLVFSRAYWDGFDVPSHEGSWVRNLRDTRADTLVLPHQHLYIATRHRGNTCSLGFYDANWAQIVPQPVPAVIQWAGQNLRSRHG